MKGTRSAEIRYHCLECRILGNPVAQGLYGGHWPFICVYLSDPDRIFMWSSGISCFQRDKRKKCDKKVLTHPCIIAVMIGLVLMLAQATLPPWIETPLRTAGNCNTALSMIVIGNILAEINFRDVSAKRCYGTVSSVCS